MRRDRMPGAIETERLVLFPYTAENLALFNTDLPRFEETYGVAYRGEELDYLLTGFLKKLEQEIADDPEHFLFFTEFLIVLKENSHIIGSVDYKYVPQDGVTEVGYGLNPAYTGRGYMTEALRAFLDFGRSLGIRKVLADTLPDNLPSQRVLQRCGFRFLREDGNLWWETDLRESADSSARLRIRPYQPSDADAILSWCRDEQSFYRWSAGILGPYPASREALRFVESLMPFTACDEAGIAGFFTLRHPDGNPEVMRFGFVIVDPAKRGLGYGKAMLRLGLQFAFERCGARRATLGVFENNLPAFHCYRSVGFTVIPQDPPETYAILGENWVCLELAMDNPEPRNPFRSPSFPHSC